MNKTCTFSFLLLLLSVTTKAQVFTKDTILHNGDFSKYINYVFLGDGYTASEKNLFYTHTTDIMADFFDKVPYSNYKNYFNVVNINVVSPESGIKHPRTAGDCPAASSFPYADPNNYFGTTFDLNGIHRLIYPTNHALIASVLANNFPNYDQILFIGNTTEYGGAGGQYAVGTAHASSVEIMLHECGHSFVKLADEYWAGDGYASEKINMTHQSNANNTNVKWKSWLGTGNVGIYQHCCGGSSAQWYKPHENCLMEFLNREFCAVCRQATVETIQSMVNTIVAYEPQANNAQVNPTMDFKLTELMLPIPNTLKIEWEMGGNIIAVNTDSIRLDNSILPVGNYVLTATVTDTTTMLRTDAGYTSNINKVSWSIEVKNNGVNIKDVKKKLVYKLYPNPAENYIYIETKDLESADQQVKIQLIDVIGRIVYEQEVNIDNRTLEHVIPVEPISSGLYFVHVVTKEGTDKMKVTIKR